MNLFITMEDGAWKERFLPKPAMDALRRIGDVRMNDYERAMTQEELGDRLRDVDVCFALGWLSCPPFTEAVLAQANRLKLIVSPGASVAGFITDGVYERGIKVCSANDVMAEYVAEGTLAYMLTALRQIPRREREVRAMNWNNRECESLIGKTVGLVGLGAVGRHLIRMLQPFRVRIKLYDPYVDMNSLAYAAVEPCSLHEVLSHSDLISIHASKTDETYRMINRDNLKWIKDGAVLINTARGSLIDEEALAESLRTGRMTAVLDVYETEPLPPDSPLRELDNVYLMPHVAGMVTLENYAWAMVKEIERFAAQEPLQYEIPYGQFKRMTK